MPRKEFESFTRLDASDVNTYLMDQSVMTFGGTAARGSAITTPVEGMVTYLEDSDAFEYWDGAAYEPLVSGGGLILVKEQTIGSAVSSVVVSDAFSADFDNYKVIITGGAGTTSQQISLQLGATTSGFYGGSSRISFSSGTFASTGYNNSATITCARANVDGIAGNFDILTPFLAKNTIISGIDLALTSAGSGGHQAAYMDNILSYTDFTIAPTASTITGGTIRVYGYRGN
jgi:hypothetical protein